VSSSLCSPSFGHNDLFDRNVLREIFALVDPHPLTPLQPELSAGGGEQYALDVGFQSGLALGTAGQSTAELGLLNHSYTGTAALSTVCGYD
jgi:hypothetical protein